MSDLRSSGITSREQQDYLNRIRLENELIAAEEKLLLYIIQSKRKSSLPKLRRSEFLSKASVADLERRGLW